MCEASMHSGHSLIIEYAGLRMDCGGQVVSDQVSLAMFCDES